MDTNTSGSDRLGGPSRLIGQSIARFSAAILTCRLLLQESIMLLVFQAIRCQKAIWYKIFYILFTPAIQLSFVFSFLPTLHLSILKCNKGVSKNERIYFTNEIKNLPINNSLHKLKTLFSQNNILAIFCFHS